LIIFFNRETEAEGEAEDEDVAKVEGAGTEVTLWRWTSEVCANQTIYKF